MPFKQESDIYQPGRICIDTTDDRASLCGM